MYTIQGNIIATLGTQGTRQKKPHKTPPPKKNPTAQYVLKNTTQASTKYVNEPSYKQLGVQRNITS